MTLTVLGSGDQGGICVYVGSALGSDRRLGQRLGRHITKREEGTDPIIRHEFMFKFGKGMFPRGEKKLLWHIDYLVDRGEAKVTDIVAIRCGERLESKIAELLMAEGDIVAKGLGASDAKGYTHLLKVSADMEWWESLKLKIQDFANL